MSTAERTLPDEVDLFFVEDFFGRLPVQIAQAGIRSSALQIVVNETCGKILADSSSLMAQRVAGSVFGKLLKPGRTGSYTQRLPPALQGCFDFCMERLLRQDGYRNLAEALRQICSHLSWMTVSSGPFASKNFEKSNAHAVVFGPRGMEERADARIGITMMSPYMRMPDHKLEGPRAFLALTDFEFSTESIGWARVAAGAVCFAPAGELVAYRCTTAPLLTMWCDILPPAHLLRGINERSTGRTARKHGI